MRLRSVLLTLSLATSGVIAVPAGLAAQETINAATVGGRVLDPQGAVVRGAKVTARQIDTNVTSETVTDQDGRFRFSYLSIGPSEITIHRDGFADVTRVLTL